MNLRYLGDALDHWKGSLFERLQRAGLLRSSLWMRWRRTPRTGSRPTAHYSQIFFVFNRPRSSFIDSFSKPTAPPILPRSPTRAPLPGPGYRIATGRVGEAAQYLFADDIHGLLARGLGVCLPSISIFAPREPRQAAAGSVGAEGAGPALHLLLLRVRHGRDALPLARKAEGRGDPQALFRLPWNPRPAAYLCLASSPTRSHMKAPPGFPTGSRGARFTRTPLQKNGWLTTRECLVLFEGINTRRIPEMKLNRNELEFLSAWAREEKALDPYALPAHQLQAVHKVRGVTLIRAIKAWAVPKVAGTKTSSTSATTQILPGPGLRMRK